MNADEDRRRHAPLGRRRDDLVRAMLATANPLRSRAALVALGTVIGLAVFGALWVGATQRRSALDSRDYAACREANIPNAFIRTVDLLPPDQATRADRDLPILWCRATVERGYPVRLAPIEERRYLAIYRRGRLPHVSDTTGRVIGSDPLPQVTAGR